VQEAERKNKIKEGLSLAHRGQLGRKGGGKFNNARRGIGLPRRGDNRDKGKIALEEVV